MSCEADKIDCKRCSCEGKKKKIKKCCKDVEDCLTTTELDGLQKGFNSKNAVAKLFKDHSKRIKAFSDRSFLKKYMAIVYSNSPENADRKLCAQWKKCILVPYNETGKSCCKGMTGHHVVPSSAIRNSATLKGCYNEDKALTVCLAGESNHKGTHGYIHMKLRDGVKALRISLGNSPDRKCPAPYSQYLSTAVDSFQTTTNNICDAKCIKKDLKENLEDQCGASVIKGDPDVSAEWGNAAASNDNITGCTDRHGNLCHGV